MRLALARNPVRAGYTPAAFRAAASEVAGTDLSAWFARVFDSTAELDYREALDWFGLRFAAESRQPASLAGRGHQSGGRPADGHAHPAWHARL